MAQAMTFSIFMILSCTLGPCVLGEQTTLLYVVPNYGSQECPTTNASRCLSLNGYIEQKASYFVSNTNFLFLDGTHLLDGVADFNNVSRIGLLKFSNSSEQEYLPIIECASYTNTAHTGFAFENVTELEIEGLSLVGCGHSAEVVNIAAISVHEVKNLRFAHIRVNQSTGRGLYLWNVFGFLDISNCNFTHNTRGGHLFFRYQNCSSEDTQSQTLVSVSSSFLGNGIGLTGADLCAGVTAYVWCTNINIEFNDLTLYNNSQRYRYSVGGNMALIIRNHTNLISSSVKITYCRIEDGLSHYGGGIFVSYLVVPSGHVNNSLDQIVSIQKTNFTGNHATGEGGGLYIITHEVIGLLRSVGLVTISDCLFDSNTLQSEISAGVALHINSHNVPGYVEHEEPQYMVVVNHTNFTRSSVFESNSEATGSTVYVFQSPTGVHIQDSVISWNNITGLMVGRSNIIFSGNVTFEGNVGINGGGIKLCDRSFIYLTPFVNVSFTGNRAMGTGGGIYVGGLCLETTPSCFYQFGRSVLRDESFNTTSMYFADNTAGIAGSAIYGGSVDYCIIQDPWMYTPFTTFGRDQFDKVFHIRHDPRDYSYLTSDPNEVCFCTDLPHVKKVCSVKVKTISMYPGSTFTVTLVVVGQKHGTVPGAVEAIAEEGTSLAALQKTQDVSVNCTRLKYTVNTSLPFTKIEFRVQHSLLSPAPVLKINRTFYDLHLRHCPIGFTLSKEGVCTCAEVLTNRPGIDCVLEPRPAVRRSLYSWIGYHNSSRPGKSGIIYHKYCPSPFCTQSTVLINTTEDSFDQNIQCAGFRGGFLCGSCPSNLSQVLGSSSCEDCSSNKFLSLILAFAAVGVVLVAILSLSNLTVTSGEVNGLIFYANIMQVCLKHIIKADQRQAVFYLVSWLNLDLGIETCFYRGMDSFGKVFLQFAFPAYLFVLAFVIIFLCRRYQRLANVMGNNSVKVLATLFFLSYAKLLRIIISIFNISIVQFPDNSTEWRWAEDGSIVVGRGKHLVLVTCGIAAVCFSLPYTIVLTFYPCMQKSRRGCFHKIHRLKPLLDAYGGVYKDRYRFWTGLLLFMRLFLFVAFAVNIIQDAYYKSAAVLFVCLLLLAIGWMVGGVYRKSWLDVLEALFIVNLALYSAASLDSNVSQHRAATVSVVVAILTFLLIVVWKVKRIVWRVFQIIVKCILRRREELALNNVPPDNIPIPWIDGEEIDNPANEENQPLLP